MSKPRSAPADAAKEAFKQEIRVRRAIYNVKQKDIADELGVAQPAVSGLLSNPDKITAERMRKIVIMCVREQDVERHRRIWEAHGDGWQCVDRGESNVPGCRTVFAYYGSRVFDTRQMSRLIDSLIQDCKALDIETLPPDKLAALVGEWDA